MPINIATITPRQKLTIEKALCDYKYIMNYWQVNDSDFQEVYYDFYLKARWAVMKKQGNAVPYFQKLQSVNPNDTLMDILDALQKSMQNHCYEFSLGSKLFHTRNPQYPIYDKKIREYLSREEKICFWWHQSGAPSGITEIQKIQHDWNELINWYKTFLNSAIGKQWICWFDTNYPSYKQISDVKKIDFIIFATN